MLLEVSAKHQSRLRECKARAVFHLLRNVILLLLSIAIVVMKDRFV